MGLRGPLCSWKYPSSPPIASHLPSTSLHSVLLLFVFFLTAACTSLCTCQFPDLYLKTWRLCKLIGRKEVRRHGKHSNSEQTSWTTHASGDTLRNMHISEGEAVSFGWKTIAFARKRISKPLQQKLEVNKTLLVLLLRDPSACFQNQRIHKTPLLPFECIFQSLFTGDFIPTSVTFECEAMEEWLKLHEIMRVGFQEILSPMMLRVWVNTYNLTLTETQREMETLQLTPDLLN